MRIAISLAALALIVFSLTRDPPCLKQDFPPKVAFEGRTHAGFKATVYTNADDWAFVIHRIEAGNCVIAAGPKL